MIRAILPALVAATIAQAQSPFEGSVSMTLTDNGRSMPMSYLIKGGKIRVEMPGPRGEGAVMILDPAAKVMMMLMDDEKMYMEQSLAGAMGAAAAQRGKPATVTRTGRTETIAGHACEHVTVVEANGDTSDVCVATGLGTFMMPSMGGRGGPPAEAWASGLEGGGFPLKVQKGNKVEMLVTAIDRKPLDAALFGPPAGYTKMTMGGMMRRRP